MKRLILSILMLGFVMAQEPELTIKESVYIIVPEIPKDYSITYEIHPRPKEVPQIKKTENKKEEEGNTKIVPHEIPIASDHKEDEIVKESESVKVPGNLISKEEENEKEVLFEDIHKVSFEGTKNYELNNVNDGSVIGENGKIEQKGLEATVQELSISEKPKENEESLRNNWATKKTIKQFKEKEQLAENPLIQSLTPTENTNTQIPTEQKIKPHLKGIGESETNFWLKFVFSLMLGISVLTLIINKKDDGKSSRYIPTSDDEIDTFK